MKEGEKVLVLCDTEEEYAHLLTEFLRKHQDLPWKIHTYTDVDELLKAEKMPFEMLVVSESAYCETIQTLQPLRLVILNESGVMKWENIHYVDKYQRAEEVLRGLLQVYMEVADAGLPRIR